MSVEPVKLSAPKLSRRTLRKRPNMDKQFFEKFDGHALTDSMLDEAARLFNENYGIWGVDATNPQSLPKPGKLRLPTLVSDTDLKTGSRVKLSKNRLRAQYLPENASCTYVKVTIEDRLAGNAFACRWRSGDEVVCWVAQLVVHHDFRERRLAARLLDHLKEDDDATYGLMSSHPAACLAAAKAFGKSKDKLIFHIST